MNLSKRLLDLGHHSYNSYLQSEYWRAFAARQRKDRCFCCGVGERLQVHHLSYERLGRELPQDVVTVCGRCHFKIHVVSKESNNLDSAHFTVKKKVLKANPNNWVKLGRLVNKSKKQKYCELIEFVMDKGLVVRGTKFAPTEKAFSLGFVKVIDDGIFWNKKKYLVLLESDKQVKKYELKQRRIPPELAKRALLSF